MNTRRWWIGTAVLFIATACAGGGAQEQTDAAVAPAQQAEGGGECGGRYEIQVRNDTFDEVEVFFMRSQVASSERAGSVNPRDERSFFIQSNSLYEVWANVGPIRVLVGDRSAQQRTKVYLGVACAG